MQDRKPDLILASASDVARYEAAGAYSGLPEVLSDLRRHPLALEQRGRAKGYDHIHLSIAHTDRHLVRWSGRGPSGYHYPIGSVMVILHAAEVLYPSGPVVKDSLTTQETLQRAKPPTTPEQAP